MPWLSWTVFNSRRTPKPEFDRLADLLSASGAPVAFVRYAEGGLLSNMQAFRSDLVLATANSMSMVAEAIASGRPTGILFADGYRPPKRDAKELKALISHGRAFPVTFSAMGADAVLKGAEALKLSPVSQLDVLYQAIVRAGI